MSNRVDQTSIGQSRNEAPGASSAPGGPSGQRPEPLAGTEEQFYYLSEINTARRQALSNIRTAAEKWGGTIGVLTGLLGLAALFKGREDINELTPDARLWVLVALVAGIILAFIAVLQAALIAQGVPQKIMVNTETSIEDYKKLVTDSANKLIGSRIAAVLAVTALGIATTLLWYGPGKDITGTQKYLIVPAQGSVLCGPVSVDDKGVVTLRTTPPTTLTNITSMTPISECYKP